MDVSTVERYDVVGKGEQDMERCLFVSVIVSMSL